MLRPYRFFPEVVRLRAGPLAAVVLRALAVAIMLLLFPARCRLVLLLRPPGRPLAGVLAPLVPNLAMVAPLLELNSAGTSRR